MKNPDYTTIKNINNLPKYEFGKMSSISATGYQPGNDVVNTGYIESTGADFDDMTSSQRTANTMQTVSTAGKAATNLYQTVSPSIGYLTGASGATKGTAAAAGYVGGALSAVMGGFDIYGGANSIHNAMTDDELKTWSGSQVNYGYGNRAYTTHTFDAQGAKKLIDSRISGGKTQGVLGAAQTGSGVGSVVGTAIAPGLGTVIGTVGGGILGAIGGLIGFSGAGSNVNEKLDNLARAYDRNAVQARAVANTLGMQDEFNAKHGTTIGNSGLYHAKYGVKPGTSLKDTDKPQPVNTAYGVTYGRPNAVTNGKEGIYNPITGAYSRVEGDGKENKATAIDKSDAIINEKDRSAFEYAMSVGDYETMNNIMMNQGKRKKKRLPSYDSGLIPGGAMLGSYLANMGSLLYQDAQDRSQHISRYNPYVPNGASTLYANQARPYKDFSPIQALNDELSRSMYYTRHGGAMTAGQRMGMQNALLTGNANAKANMYNTINSNYYNQMNDYSKVLASLVDQDNARQIASNQYADQEYNKKLSIKNNYLRQNRATMMQNTNDLAKNFMQLWQFNKNVDLWNRKLDNDAKSTTI